MSATERPLFPLLALLLVLLLSGCGEKESVAPRPEPPAVPVLLGEVSTRRVELVLEQVGTLTALHDVTLRSESEGRVVEIAFREGQPVRKGEVLVRLDAARVRANIVNLEAQISELHARLENKLRTLERNRPLLEKKLISRLQFDNLETEIAEVRAQIEQTRANLVGEQVRLADTVIRAPFAGVAGVRTLSPGDYLKVGDPVVTVVDLDPLEISFQVPEKFKPKFSPGQIVNLQVAPYPERTFTGLISFVAPRVDEATRTFQVKAQVKNSEHLLSPGLFARASVVTDVFAAAITVPWESIIQTEQETYLYTVQDNIARKVPVRLGRITPQWVQLLDSELTPGSAVILEGKFASRDGGRVAPKAPAAPAGAKE
ncbi:MAG: efflux RND transporter periplasmic adaptor subunit [Desulfuromonadales bacterium]|nr:efflux RND transporter periplasmic adaptor subunit [Desulfuromonadales bacterium]